MKYLGRDPGTPPDGWRLHSFADGWIGATHDSEPDGPMIFSPTTVCVEGREVADLSHSRRRFQTDPETEREQTGRFWDLWALQPEGTIWPRGLHRSERRKS